MNGAEFIHVATTSASLSNGEPTWRSSVSRAYYGALHHCREFLEMSLRIEGFNQPDLHGGIPLILGHSGDADLKGAGDQLRLLKDQRNNADYRLASARFGTQEFARTWAAIAKNIEGAITRIRVSADLRIIQQNIKPHLAIPGRLQNWRVITEL